MREYVNVMFQVILSGYTHNFETRLDEALEPHHWSKFYQQLRRDLQAENFVLFCRSSGYGQTKNDDTVYQVVMVGSREVSSD